MASVVLTGDTSGTLTVSAPAVAGSNTQTLVATTGTLAPIVSGTSVTASGTSVDFTSIPSWVKRITVMLSGVSTNGTSPIQVQLGTVSGIESTSYASVAQTSGVATASTTGLIQQQATVAAETYNGIATICLVGSNLFVSSGILTAGTAANNSYYSGGSKTLSGTLDRIRITTVGGTNTFDAGTINILYE